jgi:DNA-binding NarL/FixJ family response regulator
MTERTMADTADNELVLVVDDDADFRAAVRLLLERAGFDVMDAADADATLDAVATRRPDLVLLDVRLPRVSGYEVYRLLRDRVGDSLPIVFVSGDRTDAYDRVAGLQLGADDYLVKPFDPDELLARIRRSVRQRPRHAPQHEPEPDATADLTPREHEILHMLAAGRRSADIARELVISPRTVGTHIQHILGKLGVSSRTQAVAIAHRTALGRVSEVEAHAAKQRPEPALLAS